MPAPDQPDFRLRLALFLGVVAWVVLSSVSPVPAAAPPVLRRDAYGGPLPFGARARLGASRWRVSPPVDLSRDGRLLAILGENGTVEVARSSTGKVLRRFSVAGRVLDNQGFSPDGRFLATRDVDTDIRRVWAIGTGKQLCALSLGLDKCEVIDLPPAFLLGGKLLATWDFEKGRVMFWHVRTGKPVGRWALPWQSGDARQVRSAAFTSDGRTLALGCENPGHISLWDVVTGRPDGRLEGHLAGVLALALSPDGRHLASGSEDQTALVWDLDRALTVRLPPAATLQEKDLLRLWGELANADPLRGRAAVQRLAGARGNSVPFLRERLKPVRAADAKEVAALIEELGGAGFARREKAYRRLAELGEAAEGGLRRALQKKPDLESYRRLGRLLARCMNAAVAPDRLCELRAVEVLERIGDRSARAVLEALARGLPEARLTFESQAALRRLARGGLR